MLAGNQYAIVAHNSNTEMAYYWSVGPVEAYPGGQSFYIFAEQSPDWAPWYFFNDFVFKTYVTGISGFFSPVDNDALNVAKAGEGDPLKLRI